jgi:hypothetical protein
MSKNMDLGKSIWVNLILKLPYIRACWHLWLMKAWGTSKLSLLRTASIVVLLTSKYLHKISNLLDKKGLVCCFNEFFGPERHLILDFCELVTREEDL